MFVGAMLLGLKTTLALSNQSTALDRLLQFDGKSELEVSSTALGTSKVCLIADGVFAPDLVARRIPNIPNGVATDKTYFVDDSNGYWTLVVFDQEKNTLKLHSVSQQVLSWYPAEDMESAIGLDSPICISRLHIKTGNPPTIDRLVKFGESEWLTQFINR